MSAQTIRKCISKTVDVVEILVEKVTVVLAVLEHNLFVVRAIVDMIETIMFEFHSILLADGLHLPSLSFAGGVHLLVPQCLPILQHIRQPFLRLALSDKR